MKIKRILAFGNPVYDIISTPAFRRTDRILSGCSTNACLAAAKMGEEAHLVGMVGSDFSERIKRELNQYHIIHSLYSSPQTGGFSLIYDERGNRELSLLGIADSIPEYVDGVGGFDFILLGPILGEVSPQLVNHIKSTTSTPVLLDPQGMLRIYEDGHVSHRLTKEFEVVAPISTVIKANELETFTITGIDPRLDPDRAVKKLHEYGCKIAIVTLAEAGSVIYDGNQIHTIPSFVVNAIDPTGAGDTYAAGFMIRYLETNDLTAVGCFASAVSSIMVENVGPDFPMTRAEVDRRARILLDGSLRLRL
jgi:sugar/nucleoside kinase (ribokinase family)